MTRAKLPLTHSPGVVIECPMLRPNFVIVLLLAAGLLACGAPRHAADDIKIGDDAATCLGGEVPLNDLKKLSDKVEIGRAHV